MTPEATKAYQAAYRAAHRVELRAYFQSRRAQDPEKRREEKRQSYAKHKAAAAERMKAYRVKHRTRITEQRRSKYLEERALRCARSKSWRDKNPERLRATIDAWRDRNFGAVLENNKRRKIRQREATPKWADIGAIRKIYQEAVRLSRSTGQQYHVDHVVPINSKIVCGLHVESNLQILPAKTNIAKGNRYWPQMPEQGAGI